ncbi:putative endonuclease [Geobacter sp. OR-1]|uniref:thermonuclease family protein n=1 Tax=Geobacter sp. OR-1 TaxID=1266765 RepID=UPI000542553C|nr:thermonuclease family protein [Geobacter sp. OR-1]GAM10354.1 putative endonuclease [Geobacter sp. OR-1]
MTRPFTKLILPLLAILLLPAYSLAKGPIRSIDGMVIKVVDGDTIHIQDSLKTKVKVRLYGIDAPETEKSNKKTGHVSKPGQPYGEEAYQALNSKLFRKNVTIDIMAIDQYKRAVGIVKLSGKSINAEMVAEGYAWAYRQYLDTPYRSEYIGLEDAARGKRLGLWQQNNPQPPWEFRKRLKNNKHL